MKLVITVGCLLVASTGLAQQSSRIARVDSLKNLDNMPVIRDTGNPVLMPTKRGSGTAVDMPTWQLPTPTDTGEASRKLSDILNNRLKHLNPDSSNRRKFHIH
jgi:hypothetical protein